MNEVLVCFAFQGAGPMAGDYVVPFSIIASSMIVGVCTIVAGAKLHSTYRLGWLLIASGILRLILVYPLGIFMLMLIPAGALEIAAAIRLRKHINTTAFLALAGINSVLVLPLIIIAPRGTSPFALFGGLLIIFGGLSLAFGLTLRARAR